MFDTVSVAHTFSAPFHFGVSTKAGSCQERRLTVVRLAILTLHEKKGGIPYPVMSHTRAYSLMSVEIGSKSHVIASNIADLLSIWTTWRISGILNIWKKKLQYNSDSNRYIPSQVCRKYSNDSINRLNALDMGTYYCLSAFSNCL